MEKEVRWKKKKGKEKGKEMREIEQREGRRGRRREKRKKNELFPAFRLSELDSPRRIVDLRIASYTWVPKSWNFVKLH